MIFKIQNILKKCSIRLFLPENSKYKDNQLFKTYIVPIKNKNKLKNHKESMSLI